MKFQCENKNHKKYEKWEGEIISIEKYDCSEIWIKSRSSIMVLAGSTSRGGFACMPDFNVGCHLVNLKDNFWNTEILTKVLGEVDGITVASALFSLSDKIKL